MRIEVQLTNEAFLRNYQGVSSLEVTDSGQTEMSLENGKVELDSADLDSLLITFTE